MTALLGSFGRGTRSKREARVIGGQDERAAYEPRLESLGSGGVAPGRRATINLK
jgi:hypothetical protein